MRAVIFLDIDGPMVTPHSRERALASPLVRGLAGKTAIAAAKFHKPAVDALNWLLEKTGAVIAITSEWRKLYDCKRVLKIAGVKARGRVWSIPQFSRLTRAEEISVWISSQPFHPDHELRFVVLDDQAPLFAGDDELRRHLIVIHPEVGLDFRAAERASEVIFGKEIAINSTEAD